jgi:hypothetical protein
MAKKIVLWPDDVQRIQLCIEHWERIRDDRRAVNEGTDADSCHLCALYHVPRRQCRWMGMLCPMSQAYGKCGSSTKRNPWWAARKADLHGDERALRKASQAMIDALQHLLKVGERPEVEEGGE